MRGANVAAKLVLMLVISVFMGAFAQYNQENDNPAYLVAEIEAEVSGCELFDTYNELNFDEEYNVVYRETYEVLGLRKFYTARLQDLEGLSRDQLEIVCRRPGCFTYIEERDPVEVLGVPQGPMKVSRHIRSQMRVPLCGGFETMDRLKDYWKRLIDAFQN